MIRLALILAIGLAGAARAQEAGWTYDQAKATPWLLQPADGALTRKLEALHQVLRIADVATTCASTRPGVEERGLVASALVGHHPNCGQTALVGAGFAGLHALVTYGLGHWLHVPNGVMVMWQAGTDAPEVGAIYGNARLIR